MDAFARVGYGVGEIGWGERPAVVAVDFQGAFTSSDHPLGGGDHIVAALRRAAPVLEEARAVGVLVVHVYVEWKHPAEFGRWKIPSLAQVRPGSGAELTDPVVWDESDLRVCKRFPSAFFGTDLSSILRRHGVDTVLIMGVTTSGCVRATINDSFSHGFRTLVVADCCGDQDAAAHESNLHDVGRRYADVIDSRAAIRGLRATRGDGGSPHTSGAPDAGAPAAQARSTSANLAESGSDGSASTAS